MKCAFCGAERVPGKLFCVECGKEFEIVSDKSTLEEDLLVNIFQEENTPEELLYDDDIYEGDAYEDDIYEDEDYEDQNYEEQDYSDDEYDDRPGTQHRLTKLVIFNAIIVCVLVVIVLLYFYFK